MVARDKGDLASGYDGDAPFQPVKCSKIAFYYYEE